MVGEGGGRWCFRVLTLLMYPLAALAAIIVVVALKALYLQVRDIHKYYRLSSADMVGE